jgi:GNAT superfamily N-acetyltransferase
MMRSPSRTILESDRVTPDRRLRLFRFAPDVFATDSLGLDWEPKTRFFHVFEAGELVANASFVAGTVNVAGADVRVVGIGGVVCRPEARGRGHASAAVAAALAYGRAMTGADFGMLFCLPRMVPFYARNHWERVPGPVLIEQPGGTVASPLEVMVKPLSDHAWPPGTVHINGRPW